jgi:hypothetical protein
MSQSSRISYDFGSVNSNTFSIDKANVTQITSITTAVSVTAQAGIITTVSATTAADSATQFTVNHPDVNANSVVFANIMNYAGSAGLPSLYIDNPSTGSFVVTIQNHHASAALNGALKISYLIL